MAPRKKSSVNAKDGESTEIREAFDLLDGEKTGFIEIDDLKSGLKELGLEQTKEDLNILMADLKKDKSGKISFLEFQKIVTDKIEENEMREEMLKAFTFFDKDKTGAISFKNLKRVAKELGEKISDEEILEMIDEADLDGDGEVNQKEFYRVMKKTNLI
uniref:EF-hand domain-containing protein n=1 Tax=Megaselia scalaris TaxID=36166 RepID=T1H110_MEGSC